MRKEIGRGLFQEQDHHPRDVARLISDIRDAEVRLQTVRQFQRISERRGQGSYRNLEEMLALELDKNPFLRFHELVRRYWTLTRPALA